MGNYMQERSDLGRTAGGFVAGLLMGGLLGSGAMLLLAPQSGKRMRAQIQLKSMELREQTTEAVEDALKQARTQGRQIRADVREKADELQQHGQAVLNEQKARWSTLVEAGKTAVQGSQA